MQVLENLPKGSVWRASNVDTNCQVDFSKDGQVLDPGMASRYEASRIPTFQSSYVESESLFRGIMIFDATGGCVYKGDIRPKDIKGMKGVFYVLKTERVADLGSRVDLEVETFKSRGENEVLSPFARLSSYEARRLGVTLVKSNAVARIVDGVLETSTELIKRNS